MRLADQGLEASIRFAYDDFALADCIDNPEKFIQDHAANWHKGREDALCIVCERFEEYKRHLA